MKKYNSQPIKTISIIGSFRKHMEDIKEAKETFENKGLEVIVPKSTNISGDNNSSFVFLDTDKSEKPNELERDYLKGLMDSDAVYCCNRGGYIGQTAMFELGYLIAKGHMVYFLEQPQDELINSFIKDKTTIGTPQEICERFSIENEVWEWREWFDSDNPYDPSFSM